jgi:hypothetical protein
MVTTAGVADRRMRRRLVAVLAAGLLAFGVGVAVASPPRSAAFDDADGRTWLPALGADGTRLLVVNGWSGLVEAEATVDGADGALAFAGAEGATSAFTGAGRLVAVDEATHRATSRALAPGSSATVVPGGVLVLDGDEAALLPDDLTGSGRAVALPVPPADAAVAPVVDGAGRAWYQGARAGGGKAAVGLGPSAPATTVVDVDPGTARLAVVDGAVAAVGARAVVPVEAGGRAIDLAAPPAGADRIDPVLAVATGGTWATAAGSTITTTGTISAPSRAGVTPETQDVGAPVTALAVWHGRVVATTAEGAVTGRPGDLRPLDGVGPGARLHQDGGLLWVTTAERAVAIAPDHEQVDLDLAGADLSLCVGDCSAAAASTFLEERATPPTTVPPAPGAGAPTTTTTAPARRLDAAVVTPTLPTTSTTARPTTPSTTTPSTTALPVTEPGGGNGAAPTTVADPVAATTPPTAAPSTSVVEGKPGKGDKPPKGDPTTTTAPLLTLPLPGPEESTTTVVEAPSSTDTTDTTDASPTTTEASTTTTEPGPGAVGLELEVAVRPGEATATFRVLARPSDCGATDTSTAATLVWQGAATGTRQVLVTWPRRGAGQSNVATATIPSPAGDLTVSVVGCGVAASRAATVPADPSTTTTTTTPPPSSTTTTPPSSTTTTTTRPSTTTSTPTTSTTAPPP